MQREIADLSSESTPTAADEGRRTHHVQSRTSSAMGSSRCSSSGRKQESASSPTSASPFLLLPPPRSVSTSVLSSFRTIDTSTLSKIVEENSCGYSIVDARDSNVFNGWPGAGSIKSGGHIRGAVNFASSWVALADRDVNVATKLLDLAKGLQNKMEGGLLAARGDIDIKFGDSKVNYDDVGDCVFAGCGARGCFAKSQCESDTNTAYTSNTSNIEVKMVEEECDKRKGEVEEDGKFVPSANDIIIYDFSGGDSIIVADYLRNNLGFGDNIYLYKISDWIDSGLTLESFPNYYHLVPPEWIHKTLYGESFDVNTTEGSDESNKIYKCDRVDPSGDRINTQGPWKVFHTAWGEEESDEDYKTGHIKSAVYINTDEFERWGDPLGSLKPGEDLLEFAISNGICKTDNIILYSTDIMSSFRTAILLLSLGVQDVRVLNGGFNVWKAHGYPLETTRNPKVRDESRGILPSSNNNNSNTRTRSSISSSSNSDNNSDCSKNSSDNNKAALHLSLIVDIEAARLALVDPASKTQLIDIRSWDEHVGVSTGYTYSEAKGRPLGCIFGNSGLKSDEAKIYRNIDDTMKSGNAIFEMWTSLGIDYKNKNLIFFCGSGWRASEVLFYSRVIGTPNPCRLYSSGWFEWAAMNKLDCGKYKIEFGPPLDVLSAPKTLPQCASSSTLIATNMIVNKNKENCANNNIVAIPLPPAATTTLYPPKLFHMVTEGVYRSALPTDANFEFLSKIGLRTVVLLTDSTTHDSVQLDSISAFVRDRCSAKLILVEAVSPNLIADEEVGYVLELIANSDNLPCLVSCSQGAYLTGTVMACLRRLQNWSIVSIFEEYRRFARPPSAHSCASELFIEMFDCANIRVDRSNSNSKCPIFLRLS